MSTGFLRALVMAAVVALVGRGAVGQEAAPDPRLDWWREARFGMFIHWGLYAIPAGEWGGKTGYGEWIMNHAQIPVDEYEKFVPLFDPRKFDARAIARTAREAGMKYIVITTKHHDGFALWDSKLTDYDVMATPFKRDVMKELATACRAEGIKICWYHSIMDWHHPDYLPRREWETRAPEGAEFRRYVDYMKGQLKELLTKYGPIGVVWFDGQWEGTWNDTLGKEVYDYVRELQPRTIVNNRVGKAGGTWGLNAEQGRIGDFGTPEQEIPAQGIPGMDWETCMTMNGHWGYNRADKHFKTTEDLIQKLADIASKGGNFLLNVGPTAEGEIPGESLERLKEMGAWMRVNGSSIYGTSASPFPALSWGRCTQASLPSGKTRLFLHVFDWPRDGVLTVGGILNEVSGAYLLSDPSKQRLNVSRSEDAVVITVPRRAPDRWNSVVVLDVVGKPDIAEPPVIRAETDIFVNAQEVSITSRRERVEVRYTVDGSEPGAGSDLATGPVWLNDTATVKARAFRDGKPVSPVSQATFTKATPRAAERVDDLVPGLRYEYYESKVGACAELSQITPMDVGTAAGFDLSTRKTETDFGYRFTGYVNVPADGAYRFYTRSDDGSRLLIGGTLVVDNDLPHSLREASGVIALGAGLHPITVEFFENSGGFDLKVMWSGPGVSRREIPASLLMRKP